MKEVMVEGGGLEGGAAVREGVHVHVPGASETRGRTRCPRRAREARACGSGEARGRTRWPTNTCASETAERPPSNPIPIRLVLETPVTPSPTPLSPSPSQARPRRTPDAARARPRARSRPTPRSTRQQLHPKPVHPPLCYNPPPHAPLQSLPPHPQRNPGRRDRREPHPPAPRGVPAAARGGHLQLPAALLPGAAQDRSPPPRGDGPHRRAGVLLARPASGGALEGERPLGGHGREHVPPQGPRWPGDGSRDDSRGGLHLHRPRRAAQLPAAPADLVPDPDQVPRRAAPQERGLAGAPVHDERRLQLRPRPGRAGRGLRGRAAGVPAHLHPLRPDLRRGRRPQRRDGRQRLHRVHGPHRRGRGRRGPLRGLWLRRERRARPEQGSAGRDHAGRGAGAEQVPDAQREDHRRPGRDPLFAARDPAAQDFGLRRRRAPGGGHRARRRRAQRGQAADRDQGADPAAGAGRRDPARPGRAARARSVGSGCRPRAAASSRSRMC